jgi:hypothetical protein
MKINYKNIEIVIFRNYEGKYGIEQEHLDTITGDEVDTSDEWIYNRTVDIEDIIDAVRNTLESAYTKNQLKEEK